MIAMSSAMTPMETRTSTRVKPFRHLELQRKGHPSLSGHLGA
jgi:hypothetical protein